jgi:2-polyprenyl-3-methyl-5-hydroxy-6-metoxy-1,4-benzoquinol methylase
VEQRERTVEDLGSLREIGAVSGGGACRHCGAPLERSFCDLGTSPLANSYLRQADLGRAEKFYPLHAFVCGRCFLVQLQEFESPETIFGDYAYFSSYSTSWLEHARLYTDEMTERFHLGDSSQVIEIASNDGYLLQYFVAKQIPALGIEPAANVAAVAEQKGVRSLVRFFGTETATALAGDSLRADLLLGNNVLAHVPDLNDFVRGLKIALKPDGVVTMEFPHLLRLMADIQFDTIYHEHFSYFSFLTVVRVFAAHGLRMFDVQQLPTHGGSLRIFATHVENRTHQVAPAVIELLEEERGAGFDRLETYESFGERVRGTKRRLLTFLIEAREQGKTVVGYGAPAKGNTLLNYCGVGTDFIDYTVDRSPHKQDTYLPGSRVPVFHPDRVRKTKPDYLLILPWNLEHEIKQQMAHVREWGGRFVIPIPEVKIRE